MQTEWLTPKETHAELNAKLPYTVSLPTVYRMAKTGIIRSRAKVGGGTKRPHLLIDSMSVNELIQKETMV